MNNLPDCWGNRDMPKQQLSLFIDTRNIENIPYWKEAAQIAEHIIILIDNDQV